MHNFLFCFYWRFTFGIYVSVVFRVSLKKMEHLHSNSVEQVRAKISLLRVEGGNEQRFAWVAHGDALA